MAMVLTGLSYLAAADPIALAAQTQAGFLQALEQGDGMSTAARASDPGCVHRQPGLLRRCRPQRDLVADPPDRVTKGTARPGADAGNPLELDRRKSELRARGPAPSSSPAAHPGYLTRSIRPAGPICAVITAFAETPGNWGCHRFPRKPDVPR